MIFICAIGLLIVAAANTETIGCPTYRFLYSGNEVSPVTTFNSWGLCGQHCKLTDNCRYWSWTIIGQECRLKTNNGQLIKDPNSITGDNSCPTYRYNTTSLD